MSLSQNSMVESSLFTGFPMEPQQIHELLEDMRSTDAMDILVSFIKWSGLRLLISGFEACGTTDSRGGLSPLSSANPAIEWPAYQLPNVQIYVPFDIWRTRLHANAWHFRRESVLSTAYFGFGFFYILLDYKQVIILLKC